MSETFTTKHGLIFTQSQINPNSSYISGSWEHQLPSGYINVHLYHRNQETAAFGVSHEEGASIARKGLSALEAAELMTDLMISENMLTLTPTPS